MARCSWDSSGSLASGESAKAEREKKMKVRVRVKVEISESFVKIFILELLFGYIIKFIGKLTPDPETSSGSIHI
jgi:hypothetical protein